MPVQEGEIVTSQQRLNKVLLLAWEVLLRHRCLLELWKFRQSRPNLAIATEACLLEVCHRHLQVGLRLLQISPQVLLVKLALLEFGSGDPGVLLFDLAHALLCNFLFPQSDNKTRTY